MNSFILLFSSNFDALRNIEKAKSVLEKKFGKAGYSECLSSEAVGNGEGIYFNAVGLFTTDIEVAEYVNKYLKEIEIELGRVKGPESHGKVAIDLDLVEWNGEILRPADYRQTYYQNCIKNLEKSLGTR